ncbi:AAA family ATPase [Caulobacter endophyticus]|uniref:Protein CR006 P-loop domain-containing protein n=1 Tax=Caulobacter endophyticus TaxID=2172652 RepID=A0A2T9KCE7_9CAUL|nr:AAA family ATPase [Caulobacter endophyticus]PVM93642.1 hypothetical protein DDF67_02850 [Caulobacter endophyticus]
MADAHPLLKWADRQVDWARDALRRHAQSPNHALSAADGDEIISRVRQAAGAAFEKPLDHAPIEAKHITFRPAEGERALLCSLGPVENIGRLAGDQKLSFCLNGITLIYGDNGSGKSGYCRVTKKVCRSITTDTLQGNVFAEGDKPPAKALIRFMPGGVDEPVGVNWTDGEDPPAAVKSISVFDTSNARLYVDKDNRIGFLPAEISLLERHAAHRSEMDAKFQKEKKDHEAACKTALPVGFGPGGAVAQLFAKLTPKETNLPTSEEVSKLGEFSGDDANELETLTIALGQEPEVIAARLERGATVLKVLLEQMAPAEAALSEEQAKELEAKWGTATAARKAAEFAANEQFAGEPLKDVGKSPWSLMYRYARDYALSLGFGDLPADAGDPCTLCQQPLSQDAAERVGRFNSFIAGEATKAATLAVQELTDFVADIDALVIATGVLVEQQLAELKALNEAQASLTAKIVAFFIAAHKRRADFKEAAGSGIFQFDADPLARISDLVADAIKELEAEAASLKDQAKLDTQKAANIERHKALSDRKWLSGVLPTILERLKTLHAIKHASECSKLVSTAQVSTQITTIRRALVTQGLDTRIKEEIAALDLNYMPFEVSDRSRDGNSFFEVKLKAAVGAPANAEILSEGEQRALALACFLAEVGADKANHGLVFDDPVSSLDHLRIRRVAARLVAEAAKGKQIIVFTHNLLFYNEMLHLAASASPAVPTVRRVVTKTNAGGFGLISEEAEPWSAQKVSSRIEELRKRAKVIEGIANHEGELYRRAAKDFYTDLRETWERLVEELLLGKVVERYSSDVRTQSLRSITVTSEDHKTVFFAMKRVSEFSGHDQAVGKQVATPTPDDMKKDLDAINEYRVMIASRAKELEKERKALEAPPAGMIA